MHEKRMHRVNEERGRLKCERCGRGFDAEGQRVSHVRSCMGGAYGGEGDSRQCGGCKRWVSRANYARHVRSCGRVEARGAVEVGVRRGGQVRMATCGGCGREMRAAWPGTRGGRAECGTREGGQTPDEGRRPDGWVDGLVGSQAEDARS